MVPQHAISNGTITHITGNHHIFPRGVPRRCEFQRATLQTFEARENYHQPLRSPKVAHNSAGVPTESPCETSLRGIPVRHRLDRIQVGADVFSAKNHPSPAWALAGPAILPCFGIGLLPMQIGDHAVVVPLDARQIAFGDLKHATH